MGYFHKHFDIITKIILLLVHYESSDAILHPASGGAPKSEQNRQSSYVQFYTCNASFIKLKKGIRLSGSSHILP